MKTWKLVVIAVLAMVPAAFAAPTLQLSPSAADAVPQVDTLDIKGLTQFTLNVNLNGDGSPVLNCSFAVSTDAPGMLRLVGRTVTSPVLSEVQTSDAQVLSAANSLLSPKNARDLGLVSADGESIVTGKQTICTLTFAIEGSSKLPNPAHLYIVGPGVLSQATWGNPDFESANLPMTSITLTPEPASMLLLAAGAAFFARRRRA